MKSFGQYVIFTEGLALKGDYKGSTFQQLVAAFYELAPASDPEALAGYRDLWAKINRQNKFLQSKFTFNPSHEDSYSSFKSLKASIDAQRASGIKKPVMNVYAEPPGTQTIGHPVFTNDQNVVLRGVHDAIAHLYGNHPFSARGEYSAYLHHLKTLCNPEQAKAGGCGAAHVLFTEIVGQTSYYYVYGTFPEQKAVILKHFDHYNVGRLDPTSPLNRFFEVKDKQLVPKGSFSLDELGVVDEGLPGVLRKQHAIFRDRAAKKKLKYGLSSVGSE